VRDAERESRLVSSRRCFPLVSEARCMATMRSATPNRGVRFKRSATFPGGSLETQIGNYSVLSRRSQEFKFSFADFKQVIRLLHRGSFGVRLP